MIASFSQGAHSLPSFLEKGMPSRNIGGGGELGKVADLDRIGLFSEAPYISIGDKYNEHRDEFLSDRTKGKQFVTNPSRKGHDTRDAYFSKEFVRVFENEPYTDLVALRRRWRLQAKEKNIDGPFRPPNVPPKPSGKGSAFGTFQQQWPIERRNVEDIPSFSATRQRRKEEPKRNFVTNPPKKGSGYGYPHVTIGKDYEYKGDPYDAGEAQTRKEREIHKEKVIGERPFVSSGTRQDYFAPFVSLLTATEGAKAKTKAGKKSGKLPLMQSPFKPSSAIGYTINKYPTHEVPSGGKNNDQEPNKILKPALIFRPGGVSKTFPIKSIVASNTPLAPPPWIKEAWEGKV